MTGIMYSMYTLVCIIFYCSLLCLSIPVPVYLLYHLLTCSNDCVAHKTFHRYTVRAKCGTVQSARDGKHGGHQPRSAGANLRRYNEAALEEVWLCISDACATCTSLLTTVDHISVASHSALVVYVVFILHFTLLYCVLYFVSCIVLIDTYLRTIHTYVCTVCLYAGSLLPSVCAKIDKTSNVLFVVVIHSVSSSHGAGHHQAAGWVEETPVRGHSCVCEASSLQTQLILLGPTWKRCAH